MEGHFFLFSFFVGLLDKLPFGRLGSGMRREKMNLLVFTTDSIEINVTQTRLVSVVTRLVGASMRLNSKNADSCPGPL